MYLTFRSQRSHLKRWQQLLIIEKAVTVPKSLKEVCGFLASAALSRTSDLLGLNSDQLAEVLTHRSMILRGEEISTPLTVEQVSGLYNNLWLSLQTNYKPTFPLTHLFLCLKSFYFIFFFVIYLVIYDNCMEYIYSLWNSVETVVICNLTTKKSHFTSKCSSNACLYNLNVHAQ